MRDLLAAPGGVRARVGGISAIVAALLATLTMAVAAPAQAAPNVAYAWGANNHGQLAQGSAAGPEECGPERAACSTLPLAVSGLGGVKSVAAGGGNGLALLENGTVMAWGSNGSGSLGDGTTSSSDVPVGVCEVGYSGPTPCPPERYLKGVTAIAADPETEFNVALLEDGTVVDWGTIAFAKLGDGSTAQSSVPVHVCEVGYAGETPCTAEHFLRGITAISAGDRFVLALVGATGGVDAWGENANSAPANSFGDGTENPGSRNVPVAVCAVAEKAPCAHDLSGVSAIAAGGGHALALVSGTVVAWGRNTDGELGDGSTTGADAPVAVQGLSLVSGISAGQGHSLALLTNGTVEAWGANERGEVGDGTNAGPERCGEVMLPCSKAPVAVTNLSNVNAIAAGGEASLARLSSGSILAWGSNEDGQLGDGTSTGPEACPGIVTASCSTRPVAVLTHGAVTGIAAGQGFALAFGPPPPPATPFPELGHCVKVNKTGAFGGTAPRCIGVAKTHKGNFEWFPGPGSKAKFKETLASPKLETVGKTVINCTLMFVAGQYTGAKSATITSVSLEGCEEVAHHQHCENGPLGKIENTPGSEFEAELGFIVQGEKPQVGWDLKPKGSETTLLNFKCGTTEAEALSLEGSVIGRVLPLNKMVASFGLLYTQKAGYQTPERFEGGLKDTLLFTRATASPPAKSSEQMGLASEGSIEGEEELEIKAKV